MSQLRAFLCLVAAAAVAAAAQSDPGAGRQGKPADHQDLGLLPISIYRLPLPVDQTAPLAVPTTPDDTTVVELPYPMANWFGRGFTTNPDQDAGDFVLVYERGDRRFAITPLTASAHRTLQVVVQTPGTTGGRIIALEFFPASNRTAAYRMIRFYDQEAQATAVKKVVEDERAKHTDIERAAAPPRSEYRAPTAETMVGLTRFMRLLLNLPDDMAKKAVASNPALQLVEHHDQEEPFGDFGLVVEFAVRDNVTDSLGVCVTVINHTNKRLVFAQDGWLIRAGAHVYPVTTVDFPNVVEPSVGRAGDKDDGKIAAFLVLGRAQDGSPTRLLPDNDLRITATETSTASDKPVIGLDLTHSLP